VAFFHQVEEPSFIRKLVLAVSFFVLAPLTLGLSLFSLVVLSDNVSPPQKPTPVLAEADVYPPTKLGVQVYASLPGTVPSLSGSAIPSDARSELIKQYLAYYNSPLVNYADFIVEAADRWGLDFRLITAIAQQESNLCKKIPPRTYNCWGWGIHSEGTLAFSSYKEGIETVSQGIREEYIDKGLTTPEEIMGKYTPLSQGSWAAGVETFMGEME
jgi:hypothetical protein